MVCQSASQTKFKALKHENGIAGRTTIIVRVIACFQPLQNCQIFRSKQFPGLNTSIILVALLALMVTAKESSMSQMFSAWKSPNSDQMARAQLEQNWKFPNLDPMALAPLDRNYGLTCFNPSTPTANVAFQGKVNSNSRVGESFKLPHPFENYTFPTGNPCLKNSKNSLPIDGLRDSDTPISICAPQEKKFLIFDRSGNHTRLFFSPSISPQNQFIASTTEKVDGQLLKNSVAEEEWDENDLGDGEGVLHENSEEIDALLYSDSDNDDDDDDDDYDEVTSTRRIPFIIGNGSPKRQRLLDGGYKKSSWLSSESPINPCNYEGGDESGYLGSRNFYESKDSSERDKKVRIRETLKILGSIIPGSKSENPVSVIEKAIAYLESMKIEAKALGLTYPGSKLVNFA